MYCNYKSFFPLACLDSFGIGERIISDKAIISSTTMGVGFEPFHGRLRGMSGNGSWCGKSSDLDPYLQIDLGDRFRVSMIAIQGNELYEWVQEICRYTLIDGVYSNICHGDVVSLSF